MDPSPEVITIAHVTATSSAPPAAFYERWADIESHPQWAPSMEYFRLDGPARPGATGVAKARGGTENRFEITVMEPPATPSAPADTPVEATYADITHLDGAILTVHHHATATPNTHTNTHITITATVQGPRAHHWATTMGTGVQDGITGDLASLRALLENAT